MAHLHPQKRFLILLWTSCSPSKRLDCVQSGKFEGGQLRGDRVDGGGGGGPREVAVQVRAQVSHGPPLLLVLPTALILSFFSILPSLVCKTKSFFSVVFCCHGCKVSNAGLPRSSIRPVRHTLECSCDILLHSLSSSRVTLELLAIV